MNVLVKMNLTISLTFKFVTENVHSYNDIFLHQRTIFYTVHMFELIQKRHMHNYLNYLTRGVMKDVVLSAVPWS